MAGVRRMAVFHPMNTGSCSGPFRPISRLLRALLMVLILGARWTVQSATPDPIPIPKLHLEHDAPGGIRCSWETPNSRWVVETSPGLDGAEWVPWPLEVVHDAGRHRVRLTAGAAESRWFRLRLPRTTLAATSPVRGERGVSVERETVVRFTAALAGETLIRPGQMTATFGGRSLLSRTELSADRRSLSLHYLEPLPGNARVWVTLDCDGLRDEDGQWVDGDGDGVAGGVARWWFDTLPLAPVAGTAVVGRVVAAEVERDASGQLVDRPLKGVTITVDGREQDLRAVTDADGHFTLSPVPAGRFFVHIDGRTADGSRYPEGEYRPLVGKAWDAVAGRPDNPAGGTGVVYLPLIPADALRIVSMTEATEVSFPASVLAEHPMLAGARITVPANALYSDAGNRGGRVGLAVVPPDRLPGPLPDGLNLPMVFTVQTDGADNFDQPAPVCLPNAPGVVDGAPLPAGARRSLISFDHKKGVWESVGSMRVSEDGQFLCTISGAGILQPGWHGAGPAPFVGPAGGDAFGNGFGNAVAGALGDGDGVVDGTFPQHSGGSAGGGSTPGGGTGPGAGGPGGGTGGGTGGPGGPGDGGSGGGSQEEPAGCRDGNLAECIDRAVLLRQRCQAARSAWQDQAESACEALAAQFGPDDPRVRQCYRDVGEGFKRRSRECHAIDRRMDEECAPCEHGPNRRTAGVARTAEGSPLDAVVALNDAAMALLEPHYSAGTPVPDAIRTQARALRDQARALAGGDLRGFLVAEELRQERELYLGFPAQARSGGNAPGYPIRYVATVARPGGLFRVRGETLPFGAYQFFVPGDGAVLIVEFLDPLTGRWGSVYPHRRPDTEWGAPPVFLNDPEAGDPDADGDGLSDFAEHVLGTDALDSDSDGDGVTDGVEVGRGSNPLDGIAVEPGVMASVDTPGRAQDVVVGDDLAVVADGLSGIALFNVAVPAQPILVAQVPTPGEARAVALSAGHVAVACRTAGLAIVDLTAGLPLTVHQQLDLGSATLAVAASAGEAFVGLESQEIVRVDLFSGIQRGRVKLNFSGIIQDVAVDRTVVFVLTTHDLFVLAVEGDGLRVLAQRDAPGLLPGSLRRRRLSVAEGRLYAAHRQGMSVYDVSNPADPIRVADHVTAEFGWNQLVPVMPGLALGPGGADSVEGTAHDLRIYDVGRSGTNLVFLGSIPTPGAAQAVAVWRGMALVADDASGLQVVNFQSADGSGGAPAVSLNLGDLGEPAVVREGQRFRVAAEVSAPGGAGWVEYFLDGENVGLAGGYPYVMEAVAPVRRGGRTSFRMRARVTDAAGRRAWSPERTIQLDPDPDPPGVEFTVPAAGRILGRLEWLVLGARMTEGVDPESVTPETFQLWEAGTDGVWATADDIVIGGGTAGVRSATRTVWRALSTELGPGRYRAVLHRGVRDLAGNPLGVDRSWDFDVVEADLRAGGFVAAAGAIERSGARDLLTFRARAGQRVYFDEVDGTCASGLTWRCVSPDGDVIVDEVLGGLGCGRDAGLRMLPVDGLYRVLISSPAHTTNSWSVALHDVPDPVRQELAFNQAVVDGVPGPGAGRIEAPGWVDEFTFTRTAGEQLFFEEIQGSCTSPFRWQCIAPSGGVLFDETLGGLGCGRHAGSRLLPESGEYRLVVSGVGDAVGTYGLAVWTVEPQTFAIGPTVDISDGLPGPGAGRLETPGAVDRYVFTVEAGTRVRFESEAGPPAMTPIPWRLTGPDGGVVFETCLGCTDPGPRMLTVAGEYLLSVGGGAEAGTGPYTIRLRPAP